ncbi:hypothetical protein LMED105_10105 [Limnobacter sp. MED105]|nr:hypothetical protein LMED105_10105 [Limnobacter sp. MED105]
MRVPLKSEQVSSMITDLGSEDAFSRILHPNLQIIRPKTA